MSSSMLVKINVLFLIAILLIEDHYFFKRFNWFGANEGTLKCPFWHGKYACTAKGCNIKFNMIIRSKPIGISEINIQWSGVSLHDKAIPARLAGERRQTQALKLASYGVTNCLSENMLENYRSKNNDKCKLCKTLKSLPKSLKSLN